AIHLTFTRASGSDQSQDLGARWRKSPPGGRGEPPPGEGYVIGMSLQAGATQVLLLGRVTSVALRPAALRDRRGIGLLAPLIALPMPRFRLHVRRHPHRPEPVEREGLSVACT